MNVSLSLMQPSPCTVKTYTFTTKGARQPRRRHASLHPPLVAQLYRHFQRCLAARARAVAPLAWRQPTTTSTASPLPRARANNFHPLPWLVTVQCAQCLEPYQRSSLRGTGTARQEGQQKEAGVLKCWRARLWEMAAVQRRRLSLEKEEIRNRSASH